MAVTLFRRPLKGTHPGSSTVPGVHPHTASMIAQASRVPRLAGLVRLDGPSGAALKTAGGMGKKTGRR